MKNIWVTILLIGILLNAIAQRKKTINKIIPQLSTEVSISNFTKKMHRAEGYFPSFYDASNDKTPKPIDDFTLPGIKLPDSVIPRCKG